MIKAFLGGAVSGTFRLLLLVSLISTLHWLTRNALWKNPRPSRLSPPSDSNTLLPTHNVSLDIAVRRDTVPSRILTNMSYTSPPLKEYSQKDSTPTVVSILNNSVKLEDISTYHSKVQDKPILLFHIKTHKTVKSLNIYKKESNVFQNNYIRKEAVAPGGILGERSLKDSESFTLPQIQSLTSQLRTFLKKPIINPHLYGYVYNPKHICEAKSNVVDFLFVIPSAPENFQKRRTVRDFGIGTYQKFSRTRHKMSFVFFLGYPDEYQKYPDPKHTQFLVDRESEKYGDIVQETFKDIYSNIRLKAVSMLKWVSTYCTQAKYVIRIDDDVLVSAGSLIEAIIDIGGSHDNFVVGDVKTDYRPMRSPKDKYFVSEDEFAGDIYPPFALGGLLGYPTKTVRLLYEAAQRVKPLWLDDVYITGICAPEVGAKLLSDHRFRFLH